MLGWHNEYAHPLMCMNFYSLEAADLSWRAELLPTTKVSVYLTCRRKRCFQGQLQVTGEGAVLFGVLEQLYSRGRQLGTGKGQAKGVCSVMAFLLLSFFFFFPFPFKVVMLKLQDYPSLSHIVIQVPPAAGNKVKKYDIQKLLAQCIHNFQVL